MPAPIRLYNTLHRTIEPLETREPGKVGLYVCGMTVYDFCHIGHARAMLAFDFVVRHLTHRGYEVNFVRNHTDVDDKIIARAKERGTDPLALSAFFVNALEEDLAALGLVTPTRTPKVSEHIPDILALIGSLVEKGHAYKADNGDVYFAVESYPAYGHLSGKKLDDQRAGERVAVETSKRHPGDFALWKAASGDPAEPGWDSAWGKGRPGWHIECSAMARHYLGDTFDIHGGGIDLVFPHHENEIAQSECATGHGPYARYWMHNGHLTLDKEKMSKSLGNIVRIRDILREVPGEALRLLFGETHYRSPLPYSTEGLVRALGALDRIYSAKEAAIEIAAKGTATPIAEVGDAGQELYALAIAFPAQFDATMDDDFNTSEAIAHLFDLVRAVNRFGNDKKARAKGALVMAPVLTAFALAADVLGIAAMEPQAFFDEVKQKRLAAAGKSPDTVEALIAARAAARAAKDWAEADRLRAELDNEGIVVMDNPTGSTWRMRVE
ncbi:MAG: cysteine--tRNA ligase [Myxococcota bacterium]|jgi:cysteinyl-tRNA synthetase